MKDLEVYDVQPAIGADDTFGVMVTFWPFGKLYVPFPEDVVDCFESVTPKLNRSKGHWFKHPQERLVEEENGSED